MRSVVNVGVGEGPSDGFDFCRSCVVGTNGPVSDVVVMADPVHQNAASIRAVASPPAVMTSSHVRKFRSRSAPAFVVKMVRWRQNFYAALRFVIARWQADFDLFDLAEYSAFHKLGGTSKFLPGTLLTADLENCFLFGDFPIDKLAFVKRVSDWFLTVNVFAVSQSFQRAESVPLIGRCDDDGVDVIPLADFAKVVRDRNSASGGVALCGRVMFIDSFFSRFSPIGGALSPRTVSMMERVDVADRNDLSIRLLQKLVNQIESSRTCSDNSDINSLAGGTFFGSTENRARDQQRR